METEIGVISYKPRRMPRLTRIYQKLGRRKGAFIPKDFRRSVA